jgi:hypothetical protein
MKTKYICLLYYPFGNINLKNINLYILKANIVTATLQYLFIIFYVPILFLFMNALQLSYVQIGF